MTKRELEFTGETEERGESTIVVYTLSGSLCGTSPSYELQEKIRRQIAAGLQQNRHRPRPGGQGR